MAVAWLSEMDQKELNNLTQLNSAQLGSDQIMWNQHTNQINKEQIVRNNESRDSHRMYISFSSKLLSPPSSVTKLNGGNKLSGIR